MKLAAIYIILQLERATTWSDFQAFPFVPELFWSALRSQQLFSKQVNILGQQRAVRRVRWSAALGWRLLKDQES